MERYEEIWRKQRREKVYDAICWIAVGILVLFAVVLGLIRRVGVLAAMVSLFIHSPLPWWILTPAAIAIVAGLR